MAIVAGDFQILRSTNNRGGAITATEITPAQLENLFPRIPSAKAGTGVVKYACFYLKNNHGSETATALLAWLTQNSPSVSTDFEIGLGTAAVSATEQSIANDETAPTGVTFDLAVDEANALSLPDLASGAYKAIWVKYDISAGAAGINLDNMIARFKWDTTV